MDIKKSIKRILFYVIIALVFNLAIYIFLGSQKAFEFFGAYIIEQSLSIDNLFVFLFVFKQLKIEPIYQNRVLKFGIIGAIVLRFIFILLGLAIINNFSWSLYIFGIILIWGSFGMFVESKNSSNINNNFFINLFKHIIPFTTDIANEKFLVKIKNKFHGTPLLAALILIEGSDLIFALDSIPAIFSITTDSFIIYSSNIFAILGLRNLYFVIEKINQSFKYVKYSIGLILFFTGLKIILMYWDLKISLVASLLTIFSIFLLGILFSFIEKKVIYIINLKKDNK